MPLADVSFHDIVPFILAVIALGTGIIGYVVRDALKRIDSLFLMGTEHATKLAVLADTSLREKVDDHEARLRALESGLAEIRADLKIIRSILEKSGPPRH